MDQLLIKWKSKTKSIFLLDGLGAFFTACVLLTIVWPLNEYFGLPKTTIFALFVIATFLSIYSISCFLWLGKSWRPFLRFVIVANLLYCCLTFGVLIYHYSQIKSLGFSYFLLEIIVICIIVKLEINELRKLNYANQDV